MGKSKSALPDLSKVIELKPDFIAVRFLKDIEDCSMFYLGPYATRKCSIKTR